MKRSSLYNQLNFTNHLQLASGYELPNFTSMVYMTLELSLHPMHASLNTFTLLQKIRTEVRDNPGDSNRTLDFKGSSMSMAIIPKLQHNKA